MWTTKEKKIRKKKKENRRAKRYFKYNFFIIKAGECMDRGGKGWLAT